VLQFVAIRSQEEDSPQQHPLILVLQKSVMQTEHGLEQSVVSLSSISVTRKKVKQFMTMQASVFSQGSRLLAVRPVSAISNEFEMAILIDHQKLGYSRHRCREGWYAEIRDNYRTGLLDKQATHQKICLSFDSALLAAVTRLVLLSKLGEEYCLQVFSLSVEPFDPAHPKHSFLPLCHFSSTLQDPAAEFQQLDSRFSEVFLDSELAVLGVLGLFTRTSPHNTQHYLRLAVLDCKDSPLSTTAAPETSKNQQLQLEASPDDSRQHYMYTHLADVQPLEPNLNPELLVAQASFRHNGVYYLLICYSAIGCTLLRWLFVSRTKDSLLRVEKSQTELRTFSWKLIKLVSMSKEEDCYLHAIGTDIEINQATPKNLFAQLPVAFGKRSFFVVQIDLTSWLSE